MGVGVFVAEWLRKKTILGRLTKINRLYFMRGVTLVSIRRRLPEPPDEATQQGMLIDLLKLVEEALRLGAQIDNEIMAQKRHIDDKFRTTSIKLCEYIEVYHKGWSFAQCFNNESASYASLAHWMYAVAEKDQIAFGTLDIVTKSYDDWQSKNANTTKERKVTIFYWPERPLLWKESIRGKFECESKAFHGHEYIKIEGGAPMEVVLHRILSCVSRPGRNLEGLSLDRRPELYRGFPQSLEGYDRIASKDGFIRCLDPFLTVGKFKDKYKTDSVHIILARRTHDSKNDVIDSGTKLHLHPEWENAWRIQDKNHSSDEPKWIIYRHKDQYSTLYKHQIPILANPSMPIPQHYNPQISSTRLYNLPSTSTAGTLLHAVSANATSSASSAHLSGYQTDWDRDPAHRDPSSSRAPDIPPKVSLPLQNQATRNYVMHNNNMPNLSSPNNTNSQRTTEQSHHRNATRITTPTSSNRTTPENNGATILTTQPIASQVLPTAASSFSNGFSMKGVPDQPKTKKKGFIATLKAWASSF